jgi:hypothetical protein
VGSTGWRRRPGLSWRQNPTGCTGLADYLAWTWKSKALIPIVCVPGGPVQPDNFTGFPDKFMLFMDQPPGSLLFSTAVMT